MLFLNKERVLNSRGWLLCRRTDFNEMPYQEQRYGVERTSKRRCFKLVAAKHGFADGKRVDCRRQFIAALKACNFLLPG